MINVLLYEINPKFGAFHLKPGLKFIHMHDLKYGNSREPMLVIFQFFRYIYYLLFNKIVFFNNKIKFLFLNIKINNLNSTRINIYKLYIIVKKNNYDIIIILKYF